MEGLHGRHGQRPGPRQRRALPRIRPSAPTDKTQSARPTTSTRPGTTRSCTSTRSSTDPACAAQRRAAARTAGRPRPARRPLPTSRSSHPTSATTATTPAAPTASPAVSCVDRRFLASGCRKILSSPAYKEDGMLIITFDEAEATSTPPRAAASSPGPNTPAPGHRRPRRRARRRGRAVAVRQAGTRHATPYNHYSLLAQRRGHLRAGPSRVRGAGGLQPFGADVFDNPTGVNGFGSRGAGYRLVASDGGAFTYGSAPFVGSAGGIRPEPAGVVGSGHAAGMATGWRLRTAACSPSATPVPRIDGRAEAEPADRGDGGRRPIGPRLLVGGLGRWDLRLR